MSFCYTLYSIISLKINSFKQVSNRQKRRIISKRINTILSISVFGNLELRKQTYVCVDDSSSDNSCVKISLNKDLIVNANEEACSNKISNVHSYSREELSVSVHTTKNHSESHTESESHSENNNLDLNITSLDNSS